MWLASRPRRPKRTLYSIASLAYVASLAYRTSKDLPQVDVQMKAEKGKKVFLKITLRAETGARGFQSRAEGCEFAGSAQHATRGSGIHEYQRSVVPPWLFSLPLVLSLTSTRRCSGNPFGRTLPRSPRLLKHRTRTRKKQAKAIECLAARWSGRLREPLAQARSRRRPPLQRGSCPALMTT